MTAHELGVYRNHLKSIKWYVNIQKEHSKKMLALNEGMPSSLVELHGALIGVEHACEKVEEASSWLTASRTK